MSRGQEQLPIERRRGPTAAQDAVPSRDAPGAGGEFEGAESDAVVGVVVELGQRLKVEGQAKR